MRPQKQYVADPELEKIESAEYSDSQTPGNYNIPRNLSHPIMDAQLQE